MEFLHGVPIILKIEIRNEKVCYADVGIRNKKSGPVTGIYSRIRVNLYKYECINMLWYAVAHTI